MATSGVPLWSTTAASNATADPAVNWAEGQAPSSVNDSARAMMASLAKWRDDLYGLTTAGSSTAFTVTTNATYASATAMSGNVFAIIPHTTSGVAPTLAVDGLTARAINISTGVAIPTGALVEGTPYLIKYVHATTEFILLGAAAIVTASISDEAVTNAKLANMAANTIKGRATQSTGAPEDVELGAGLSMSGDSLIISMVGSPQGRLTLTSATPVISSNVTAATSVYYTPYRGDLIPIYDGSKWVLTTFTELTLTLASAHSADAIFDLFVINDSGTIRLVTGPAWATPTAGSGARGTGAGTTELQRLNGLWTNKVSMTGRYGSTTLTVDANEGTYVGTMAMDGTNGQVSCHVASGQNRKWGIWNAYNRCSIELLVHDSTSSWTMSSSTPRPSNDSTNNSLTTICGLAEEPIKLEFTQNILATSVSASVQDVLLGIGVNSTSTASGKSGLSGLQGASGTTINGKFSPIARHTAVPSIGKHVFYPLESNPSTVGVSLNGGSDDMQFSAVWMG